MILQNKFQNLSKYKVQEIAATRMSSLNTKIIPIILDALDMIIIFIYVTKH